MINEQNMTEQSWEKDSRVKCFDRSMNRRFTPSEAVDILVRKSKSIDKGTYHPINCRQNSAFLVDISKHKSWEDVKSDLNGAYDKNLRCYIWTIRTVCDENETYMKVEEERSVPVTESTRFHLVMNSRRNKSEPRLIRSLFLMKTKDGGILNDSIQCRR